MTRNKKLALLSESLLSEMASEMRALMIQEINMFYIEISEDVLGGKPAFSAETIVFMKKFQEAGQLMSFLDEYVHKGDKF